MDEPQVGQRHEDVESKREYYHIIIFPERTWNFTSRKKKSVTVIMEHFNGILFHKSRPGNKQYTIQSIKSLIIAVVEYGSEKGTLNRNICESLWKINVKACDGVDITLSCIIIKYCCY